MAKITILAEEGCASSTVSGLVDAFSVADMWWALLGKKGRLFECRIATVDGKPVTANGGIVVAPNCSIHEAEGSDLIVVPGFLPPFDLTTPRMKAIFAWLKERREKGEPIAALCTGTFLLAESGLLDGLAATTNWQFAGEFRRRYPGVNLEVDRLITESPGLFCAGATSAFLNLCLKIIEIYGGAELASLCARALLIDPERVSQAPYMLHDFWKNHADASILRAQKLMEESLAERISIDGIASEVHISPRHFKRRFKSATGESPLAYLQHLRIEKAKKHLEDTRDSINEIAFGVGYEDVNSFRKIFRKITGMSPKDYRGKFSCFSAPPVGAGERPVQAYQSA